jgi:hypothetical protein
MMSPRAGIRRPALEVRLMTDDKLDRTDIADLKDVLNYAVFGGGHSVTEERGEELQEKLTEMQKDAPYSV